MSVNKRNSIIGFIGAVVYAICAIIVPFLKLEGFGFLTRTEGGVTRDFFWDEFMAETPLGYDTLLDNWKSRGEPLEILWTIIQLWGLVFLGLGLIGAVLVVIPPLMQLGNMDPIKAPLAKIGLIAGLVGTVVEEILFILGGLLEPSLQFHDIPYGSWIGLPVLIFLIVGWAALIVGYYFPTRE